LFGQYKFFFPVLKVFREIYNRNARAKDLSLTVFSFISTPQNALSMLDWVITLMFIETT